LHAAVEDLDQAIREIRTSIFALQPSATEEAGLRVRVIEKTAEAGPVLGFSPSVRFSGPVDTVVTGEMIEAVLATLQEALSNVARHAHATAVQVDVRVDDDLELRVRDNGVGMPMSQEGPGRGMPNMRKRAMSLGGSMDVLAVDPSGTEVRWRVPLR
jgi:signal transduction histidine kinase